jgi:ketosteroid isomerase-like protein
VSDLEDFRTKFLARQVAAEEALILGDPEPRLELWSRRDPTTLFSAGGECKSGWDEVSAFFRKLARRFSTGNGFRFDVEVVEVSGDFAYTVGHERYKVSVSGRSIAPRKIRVTHVYRREDGQWKIVHRHGDSAL